MLHDDAFLLTELQKGNEQAFKSLYEKYWEHLFSVTYYWIGSKEEVQEIVQDVFVDLWEKRSVLCIKKSLSAYLFAVTKYKVFDLIDAKVIRRNYLSQIRHSSTMEDFNIENSLILEDTQKSVTNALEKLPPKTQQIFSLSREQELTHSEIASMMNLSVKSVEYHISKALKYLKLMLRSSLLLSFFNHLF